MPMPSDTEPHLRAAKESELSTGADMATHCINYPIELMTTGPRRDGLVGAAWPRTLSPSGPGGVASSTTGGWYHPHPYSRWSSLRPVAEQIPFTDLDIIGSPPL
jgi:hypothetical protein